MKKNIYKVSNIKTGSTSEQECKKIPENSAKNKVNLSQSSKQFTDIIKELIQTSFFRSRPRHAKIKLESWLQLLSRPQFNLIWKSNKLNYLKLLNLMCHCEYLIPPFTSFPSQNFLPILQKHEINHIIDEVQKSLIKNPEKKTANKAIVSSQSKNVNEKKSNYGQKKSNFRKLSRAKTNLTIDENIVLNKQKSEQKLIQKQLNFEQSKADHVIQDSSSYQRVLLEKNGGIQAKVRRSSNLSKINPQKSLLGSSMNNSIFDSMNLFDPVSVSSQIWKYIHQPRQTRSISIDTRKMKNQVKKQPENTLKLYQTHQASSSKLQLQLRTIDFAPTMKKQYWESHSLTGNATPKYLHNIKELDNIKLGEESEIVTYRQSENNDCYCAKILWNNQ